MPSDPDTPWDLLILDDAPAPPRMSQRAAVAHVEPINLRATLDHSERILAACGLLGIDARRERRAGARIVFHACAHFAHCIARSNALSEILDLAPRVQELSDAAREIINHARGLP